MSNRLFNGKALPGGAPGPKRSRSRKSTPDLVGGGFYTFVGRDGQARLMGLRIGCQAEASRADRSFYVAGVGRFSWRSVLSLVPGIWEAPSLRDFPHQGEGEEGWPIMAPRGPALQ